MGPRPAPANRVPYTLRMTNRPAPAALQGGASLRTADVFEHLSGVPLAELLGILHGAAPIPTDLRARELRNRICTLLSVRAGAASRLLGVSNRRYARNDSVTPAMLDRTYVLADTYALAASKLGAGAAEWLRSPLERHERTPLEILDTWFGWREIKRELAALPAP